MPIIAFDPLAYARRLEKAGVERQQAEAQAEALNDFAREQQEQNRLELATKADLRELELRMGNEFQKVRTEMQSGQNQIRNWLIGAFLAIIAVMLSCFGLAISLLRP